jgi:hypothetical protein
MTFERLYILLYNAETPHGIPQLSKHFSLFKMDLKETEYEGVKRNGFISHGQLFYTQSYTFTFDKDKQCIDQLTNYQLLNMDSVPHS